MARRLVSNKRILTSSGGLLVLGIWFWIAAPDFLKKRNLELTDDLTFDRLNSFRRPTVSAFKEDGYAKFGKSLFFDSRLSKNGQISCASCHNPENSFTDGRKFAQGISETLRNTPTLVNQRDNIWFFWDGRADSLAAQAISPLLNSAEHGLDAPSLAKKILELHRPEYEKLFGIAPTSVDLPVDDNRQFLFDSTRSEMPIAVAMYGLATMGTFKALDWILSVASQSGVSAQNKFIELSRNYSSWDFKSRKQHLDDALPISELPEKSARVITEVIMNSMASLEAFERTITAYESPFDRYLDRVKTQTDLRAALNQEFGEKELRGLKLFLGPSNCSLCHRGPNFSDSQFHNVGLAWSPEVDKKLFPTARAEAVLEVTKSPFNCKNPVMAAARLKVGLPQIASCDEIDYLRMDALELVGAFKTPTLRNLATTGPYMHDGRFQSLAEVIDHYSDMNEKSAIGLKEETLQPLQLSKDDKLALLAFLNSLNSPVSFYAGP